VDVKSHFIPPSSDRFDSKLGRILANANRHEGIVLSNIVNTIRNGLAQFGVREVMGVDFKRVPFRTQFTPHICLFAERFLLFRIDRERRSACPFGDQRSLLDVPELCITIGMIFALTSLSVWFFSDFSGICPEWGIF